MIQLLLFLGVIALLTVVPLMIAGKLMGANNTGFFTCFWLVVFIGAVEKGASVFIPNIGFSVVAAVAATAAIVSFMMETSYVKGITISLLAIGVMHVLGAGLTGIGIATGLVQVAGGT